MCELLVGLPDVNVDGVADWPLYKMIWISRKEDRPSCSGCDGRVELCDRRERWLVDLPCFGRRTRLVWPKRRWRCRNRECSVGTWTETDVRIARPGLAITDRAGRWATVQVGMHGRTVSEVADDLGCSWSTVMAAVMHYGTPLVDDPDRIGWTTAVGLDEVLFAREGRYRNRLWSTQIVDVEHGFLLDIVPGRDSASAAGWFDEMSPVWRNFVRWATLDLSGPYRKTFNDVLPHALQVADPFHVRRLGNDALDETRRRVQNETLGHRGRKDDPLYRIRKLLIMNDSNLTGENQTKVDSLLTAGDPHGEVRMAWHCKEVAASIYTIDNPTEADKFVRKLAADLQDDEIPFEMQRHGRTLNEWATEICAWHRCRFTNGPTEAVNNLIKRVKRVAYGLTNFNHYHIRTLLYAGQPNWKLLNTPHPKTR